MNDGKIVKFYKVLNIDFDLIKYISTHKKLPVEGLEEITEQDYLLDRTGKTICYGKVGVIDKVETKFGWDKEKFSINP